MGIQFQAEPSEIERFAFTCGHPDGVTGHTYATHREAYQELVSVVGTEGHAGSLAVCGDEYCTAGAGAMSVHPVESDPSQSMKLSGTSTARLLAALGEPFSEFGTVDASVLSERISDALPVAGGHLQHQLEALAGIARFAAERGRKVVWS